MMFGLFFVEESQKPNFQTMKLFAVTIAGALIIGACNQKTEKIESKDTSKYICYAYENRDTVKLSININNDEVSGDLNYNIFEKDRNNGQIRGTMSGDTIIAEYQFQSEGLTSTREVAFLRKGSTLVEGFGPMDSTGTHFVDHRSFDFSGFALHETSCGEGTGH